MGAGGEYETPRQAARCSSPDADHAGTAHMAQRTFELLAFVLRPDELARFTLTPAVLGSRPVPMELVYSIVSAVAASTGFGADLFSDRAGEAVLAALDPSSSGAPARVPGISSAGAKLQFFQRWSVRMLEAGALTRTTTAEERADAIATARAIVVEQQKHRAPLALNAFLQDLARTAAAHGSRSAGADSQEVGRAAPVTAPASAQASGPPASAGDDGRGSDEPLLPLVSGLVHPPPSPAATTAGSVRRRPRLESTRARAAEQTAPLSTPVRRQVSVGWDVEAAKSSDSATNAHWRIAQQLKTEDARRRLRSDSMSRQPTSARQQISNDAIVNSKGDDHVDKRVLWRRAAKKVIVRNHWKQDLASEHLAADIFKRYDYDGSGTMDARELEKCLRRLLPNDFPNYSIRATVRRYDIGEKNATF